MSDPTNVLGRTLRLEEGVHTLGVAEAGNAGSELIAGLWTPSRVHKYQHVMSNDLRLFS